MQTQNNVQTTLPLSVILLGDNPRTYFDPVAMKELVASVRKQGIVQPILVRPFDETHYKIVAGERRFRAATEAGLTEMPVLIRNFSEAAAIEAAALTENIQREKMSPTEEARSAAKLLALHQGDHDAVANVLGWSRSTLDKRLGLMSCCESVQKALDERKIQIGHAELLATITSKNQEKLLPELLKEKQMTVAELKTALENWAQSLDAAIFDKTECASCQYNSGRQAALFSEVISNSKCTNGTCYKEKTNTELAARVAALKDDFPTVRIANPGENFIILKLVSDGPKGVGAEQAKQCRACANFGAAVSAMPDKLGNTYKDLCFDPACNANKVAARITAEKAAVAPKGKPSGTPAATGTAKGASATASDKKTTTSKATSVTDSQRLKDYRAKVWRLVFRIESLQPQFNTTLLLSLAMQGRLGKVKGSVLSNALEKEMGKAKATMTDVGVNAAWVAEAAEETRSKLIYGIVSSCYENLEESDIKRLLTWMKADLSKHWKLNAEYLELLTKSEIELVADEIGLKAYLGEKFSKILGQKKDEIIKALLAVEGFTYEGKVPGHLKYDR